MIQLWTNVSGFSLIFVSLCLFLTPKWPPTWPLEVSKYWFIIAKTICNSMSSKKSCFLTSGALFWTKKLHAQKGHGKKHYRILRARLSADSTTFFAVFFFLSIYFVFIFESQMEPKLTKKVSRHRFIIVKYICNSMSTKKHQIP